MKRCVSLDAGEKNRAQDQVRMPELRFSACHGAILDAKLQPFIWWDKGTRNKFLKDQTHYIIEFTVSVFISRALKMLNIIVNEIKRSRSFSTVSRQNLQFSFFKSTRLWKFNACASYRSWQLAVEYLSLGLAVRRNCKFCRHDFSCCNAGLYCLSMVINLEIMMNCLVNKVWIIYEKLFITNMKDR